ncbi:TIGR02147 family protein [Bdellovibrio sp. NC01]|uniref:TIGR02147 family protein n=1 Tax=Bdellovibrio sp. NC01 TaxID=2220073 RepID=UPI00115B27DD|nr:TIGR02147 family protein [Bdellovibrio sp. NC01]QDK36365.1 hypothetical protein DOE51_01495 [Bdellovibrio sp. NC01]
MSQKSFYHYQDYRELLRDKFEDLKQTHKNITLQLIAEEIGISKSFFKMVMDQERHLSLDKLSGAAKAFRMGKDEKNYFVFLACKNTVDDKDMTYFFDTLLKIISGQKGASFPSADQIKVDEAVFNNSLNTIVQTMSQLEGYQKDPEWIQAQLRNQNISKADVAKSLKTLKDSDVPEGHVETAATTEESFARGRVGLKLASEAFGEPATYRPIRYFNMTYAVDEASRKELFKLFSDFHDKAEALGKKSKSPTSIVYSSCSMFTVADTVKK